MSQIDARRDALGGPPQSAPRAVSCRHWLFPLAVSVSGSACGGRAFNPGGTARVGPHNAPVVRNITSGQTPWSCVMIATILMPASRNCLPAPLQFRFEHRKIRRRPRRCHHCLQRQAQVLTPMYCRHHGRACSWRARS